MARPRKPTKTLKLTGGYRKDRHGGKEPEPSGTPEPTRQLEGEGLWCWERNIPKLVKLGLATDLDSEQLTAMCEWMYEYFCWKRKTRDPNGRIRNMNTAWANFSKISARFGMTPADRAGMQTEAPEDEDAKRFLA